MQVYPTLPRGWGGGRGGSMGALQQYKRWEHVGQYNRPYV